MEPARTYTAFEGSDLIASGSLEEVAAKSKCVMDAARAGAVLIFDDATAETVEVDFRGELADVLARLAARAAQVAATTVPATAADPEPARGPGRPKLGVVAREVTLLPRHWEWLATQPGGASVTLRKLVEEARRKNEGKDRRRLAREIVYRFISVLAGNAPDFEEATRALFADDWPRFITCTGAWPPDVRAHALRLSGPAFSATEVQP